MVAGDRPAALADTLNFPWIMPTFRGSVRHWVETRFVSCGLTPPVARVETSSMMMLKHILTDGRHLSFLPARLVAADCPGLVALPCAPSLVMERTLSVIHLTRRELSASAKTVIGEVRATAAAPPPFSLPGL